MSAAATERRPRQRTDPRTTAGKLADLERAPDEAAEPPDRRRSTSSTPSGKQTARERIDALLDQGSFVELDGLARHRSHATSAWSRTGPTATA